MPVLLGASAVTLAPPVLVAPPDREEAAVQLPLCEALGVSEALRCALLLALLLREFNAVPKIQAVAEGVEGNEREALSLLVEDKQRDELAEILGETLVVRDGVVLAVAEVLRDNGALRLGGEEALGEPVPTQRNNPSSCCCC